MSRRNGLTSPLSICAVHHDKRGGARGAARSTPCPGTLPSANLRRREHEHEHDGGGGGGVTSSGVVEGDGVDRAETQRRAPYTIYHGTELPVDLRVKKKSGISRTGTLKVRHIDNHSEFTTIHNGHTTSDDEHIATIQRCWAWNCTLFCCHGQGGIDLRNPSMWLQVAQGRRIIATLRHLKNFRMQAQNVLGKNICFTAGSLLGLVRATDTNHCRTVSERLKYM
ncbi:hypothetical protein GGX14DRAFT_402970 [Mycena pura]|uniref:Uncharacterized protein n=1 Tax=Mycena pura TaxID=153505 RepID=A0AAD6Y1L3_9AGAR|nr:hypothetical protein GGX14DRAFT_402970 [Mycena pura]